MLYLHKLNDLTQRSADNESIYLIRELKQNFNLPLSSAKMESFLSDQLVTESDIMVIDRSLQLLSPTTIKIESLLKEKNLLHEAINLERSINILKRIPLPLSNNLKFVKELLADQNILIENFTALLNSIPNLRTKEEKISVNDKISNIFEIILRNKEFSFNSIDIVNEGYLNEISGLKESISKGFLFHLSLEEELRKVDFNRIKMRIPSIKLQEAEEIEKDISIILQGVERAYQINFRTIYLAVYFYSFIKWIHGMTNS
ncbi:MAG: hypothetical protein ABH824_04910 [Nanoarchaeota archaeon]|nr:hypothetical protein [Nanoarchaeota archaeon]MBU1631766.1 hypothetical protein [Nanoarchaeota archaeon]MBU1876166.1 hypothetical protein [Nanoarchaeota archaeon]